MESSIWRRLKHQVLLFGCEIKYLPRSENETQKLHAFGDQWLQGIFLDYLQQKGGGFSKQFIIVDWDDLHNAESVGRVMQQVKHCHHEEVRPVMYNDEFRFPLAEGDLDQPGVSASVTRKITIKKRKAAEAVEVEEVKQQEADAKRRKEQGIPDDPPSSCLDFWNAITKY